MFRAVNVEILALSVRNPVPNPNSGTRIEYVIVKQYILIFLGSNHVLYTVKKNLNSLSWCNHFQSKHNDGQPVHTMDNLLSYPEGSFNFLMPILYLSRDGVFHSLLDGQ